MTEDILIWWLDQGASEEVDDDYLENLPDYIASEVSSRLGRAGRGRLWVPTEIDCEEINWDDKNPVCELISLKSAGGIVFYKKDFEKVMLLPGFITDVNCILIKPEK